jgi:glucokinase
MELTNVKSRVVGIDIGVTKTTYAVIDLRGTIHAQEEFSTLDYTNMEDYLTALSERIINLVESNGGYESIRSVGVCCPSSNFMTGCIENPPNLQWKGVIPLAALLRDRLGLAVALANNPQCVALGEQAFGAAHGMREFIVITLGYGVGSCIFTNGRWNLGNKGFAGEIGHTCMVPDGRKCTCGHIGCLEAYCSTRGILQTARELMEENNKPSLMRQAEKLTPKLITEFCNQGDELSIETYRRTGYMLGLGLANYASVLNPEGIVLTGGISFAGKWLIEPTQESFEEHVFRNIKGQTRIVTSTLKDGECNILGASVLAWQVKEYSLFI